MNFELLLLLIILLVFVIVISLVVITLFNLIIYKEPLVLEDIVNFIEDLIEDFKDRK